MDTPKTTTTTTIYTTNPDLIPSQFVLLCEWEQWCISDTCRHASHGEGAYKVIFNATPFPQAVGFDRDEYEAGYSHTVLYLLPDGRALRVRVEKHFADQIMGIVA